jgi:CheY-like chemotaxis protein
MHTVPTTIFLADDDLDDQDFFKHALSQIDESILCLTASNGEEAIKKLKLISPLPDYIFLDLNMPRMSGSKCLAEIKKMRSLKNVPVIIYSTSSEERDINDAKKLGADYFITKPHDFKELCDTLQHFISGEWKKEKA